jgi:hypothetical protein
MQKVALRSNPKASTSYVRHDNDHIMHFSLQGSLPAGHTLALNLTLCTLSHIVCREERPWLVGQQQFTPSEMSVLLPLLDSFPYYCPYEVIFANFYNGNTQEPTVERSRKHLQEALETGIWEQELRPLRNVLSRTRLKLRDFGIDISSILETGYILKFSSKTKPES